MIQWNSERKLLVDEMGLPISITDAKEIGALVEQHCAHDPMTIFGHYTSLIRKIFPEWEAEFAKTEEDFK